jgi:hypothetical protein
MIFSDLGNPGGDDLPTGTFQHDGFEDKVMKGIKRIVSKLYTWWINMLVVFQKPSSK